MSISSKKKPKTIVLLQHDKVVITGSHKSNGHHETQIIFSDAWSSETLGHKFVTAQKKANFNTVHILLGDNLSFLTSCLIQNNNADKPEHILAAIQDTLHEPATDLEIDWKQLSKHDNQTLVQITAVKKNLLKTIGSSLKDANLTASSVEPVALSLAKQAGKPGEARLVYWPGVHSIAVIVKDQLAIHQAFFKGDDIYNQTDSLISLASRRYQLDINTLVMPKKTSPNQKTPKPETKPIIKEKHLDPLKTKAADEDLGFDEELATPPKEVFADDPNQPSQPADSQDTNDKQSGSGIIKQTDLAAPKPPLTVLKEHTDMQTAQEPTSKSKPNTKLLIIVITILVVILGIVAGGILVYRNALSGETGTSDQTIVSADPTPETTPTLDQESTQSGQANTTPPQINKSVLSINVLNGSGIPGEAGKLADVLTDASYENIQTGNAESFDFSSTVISVKEGQDHLFDTLQADLESEYTVERSGSDLPESSEHDAVITVGST